MKARCAVIVAAVFGGAVLLGAIVALHRPYVALRTLPDGTPLTLRGVTIGKKHPAPVATLWQKLAGPLPARWRTRLKIWPPAETYSWRSSNYMTVWLTEEVKAGSSPHQFRVLVADDHTNVCANEKSYSTPVSTKLTSNVWLYGLPVLAWPRRAEKLRVQVYAQYADKMLTEFRIKNPGHVVSPPPWTARPWPITVRDGDLDFTLTSLWLCVGWDQQNWKLWSLTDALQRSTRATFRVTRGNEVDTNWNAFNVREISDATGNWSEGDSYVSVCRNGETINQFKTLPPPADEAWRMTVEFSRKTGFRPEELLMVKGFRLPQAGQPQPPPFTNSVQPALVVKWESSPIDPSPFRIWANVVPENRDYRLTLVSSVDDLGRDVATKHNGHGPGSVGEILTPATSATSVDLLFAYHRSKLVTFQVKPEFYRPVGTQSPNEMSSRGGQK